MMKKSKIIAVIGPSASGKDRVVREVVKCDPSLRPIKMYTTRPQRDKNDTVYEFMSKDDFLNLVSLGTIIYYEIYNDWYYGYALREDGQAQIGVLTPSAVKHFAQLPQIELITFLLDVPEEERLERSMRREVCADTNEINRRLIADRVDFANPPPAIKLSNITEDDFIKVVQTIIAKSQN